ncbi:MAG TPA: hypothetical protein GX717_07490 [Clostridiaceae bacterium]|nr:hypothetical protein [Clostridiaceae bacterium]
MKRRQASSIDEVEIIFLLVKEANFLSDQAVPTGTSVPSGSTAPSKLASC